MILVALSMAFMTLLVIANVIAVKIIDVGGWTMSAGVIAYPFTFLVSDTIAEVYGRRMATRIVWLGFLFSVMMLGLMYLANVWPAAEIWEGQAAFRETLGSVPRIVFASMLAYLISQNHDVIAFHLWRRFTDGRHLWLRNNASTIVSQAIDTLVFVMVGFAGTLPANVIWNIIGSQYVAKLVIAMVDTPFVYALVGLVRKYDAPAESTTTFMSTPQPAGSAGS